MRASVAALLVVLSIAGCRSGTPPGSTAVPGHGAISVEVVPNPIVAVHITGNTYEFPFDLVVRETGGHAVNVTRVTVKVYAPGGFEIASDTWDAQRLETTGTSPVIAASSEARYPFRQRQDVPNVRMLSGISAELRVEGTDDTGTAVTAVTRVTMTHE